MAPSHRLGLVVCSFGDSGHRGSGFDVRKDACCFPSASELLLGRKLAPSWHCFRPMITAAELRSLLRVLTPIPRTHSATPGESAGAPGDGAAAAAAAAWQPACSLPPPHPYILHCQRCISHDSNNGEHQPNQFQSSTTASITVTLIATLVDTWVKDCRLLQHGTADKRNVHGPLPRR